MTSYGLYDTLDSTEITRIKNLVYTNFKIKETLNFDNINSEWCTLTATIDNDADNEYIVKSFTVNLSEEYFQHQNYYLTVNYYDLQTGDLTDEYNYDTLQTKEYQLSTGNNTITLNNSTPCYLLKDFKLTVKK